MSERMIPLRLADQAVAACEAELQKLRAENALLKAEVERLTEINATLALRYDATKSMLDGCAKEIEEMEAEVERLSKKEDYQHDLLNQYALDDMRLQAQVDSLKRAGDLMLKYACANVTYPCYATMAKDWNDAKGGKQP